MSIRLIALYIFLVGLSIYAWKDWFKSLCGLILIMVVIRHEDMPKVLFGIHGFDIWNILFLVIFLAWAVNRRREGLTWDMPWHVSVFLLAYLVVIFVSASRAVFDRSYIEHIPTRELIGEIFVNSVKYILPAILLFDGCRTRRRVVMVIVCILAMYFLLSVQVVKRMPWESALGGTGESIQRIRIRVCQDIGYSSCDMSTILAGASWGVLAALPLVYRKKYKLLLLSAAGMIAFGQALTGGRAGYAAWGATGLVLCVAKWRKYLLLAPVAVILLPILLPGVVSRMMYGFGQTDVSGQTDVDEYEITSGRNLIWPHVVTHIGQSPLVGYGRLAMQRTGLTRYLGQEYGESEAFPHPHNMYLETLLDNGILGSMPIFLFWGIMLIYSTKLFRSDNQLFSAVGGLALALMLAQLFAGIGAQHFYPSESTMCAWAAMLLALRIYVEQTKVQMEPMIVERPWQETLLQQQVAIDPVYASGAIGS